MGKECFIFQVIKKMLPALGEEIECKEVTHPCLQLQNKEVVLDGCGKCFFILLSLRQRQEVLAVTDSGTEIK